MINRKKKCRQMSEKEGSERAHSEHIGISLSSLYALTHVQSIIPTAPSTRPPKIPAIPFPLEAAAEVGLDEPELPVADVEAELLAVGVTWDGYREPRGLISKGSEVATIYFRKEGTTTK